MVIPHINAVRAPYETNSVSRILFGKYYLYQITDIYTSADNRMIRENKPTAVCDNYSVWV